MDHTRIITSGNFTLLLTSFNLFPPTDILQEIREILENVILRSMGSGVGGGFLLKISSEDYEKNFV